MTSCVSSNATTTTIDASTTPTTTTATTTTGTSETTVVEVVVDVVSVLGLGTTPVAQASATLEGGVQLGVRVKGPEGAALQTQDGEGVGVVREGTTLELDFGGRSISITRLELAAWDASDAARLEFSNTPTQKRQMGSVDILSAQQSIGDATRDGFTNYVLVASGAGAEFSLKSFAFVARTTDFAPTSSTTQEQSVTSPPEQRSSEAQAGSARWRLH
jgi:hypothetical protein